MNLNNRNLMKLALATVTLVSASFGAALETTGWFYGLDFGSEQHGPAGPSLPTEPRRVGNTCHCGQLRLCEGDFGRDRLPSGWSGWSRLRYGADRLR